jgi:hypothetical protein
MGVGILLVASLIGATLGVTDYIADVDSERKRLAREKANKEAEYNEAVESLNMAYTLAKQRDTNAANRMDASTTNQENWLAESYNTQMKGLSTQIEQQGFQNQTALIQSDQAIASAYAQAGVSGVRGGSTLHQAIGQQESINRRALELNDSLQQSQIEQSLIGAYAGLNQQVEGLGNNRYQAAYARNMYTQGGEAFENYNLQKGHLKNQWDRLADSYDRADPLHSDNLLSTITGGFSAAFGGAYQMNQTITNGIEFGTTYNDLFKTRDPEKFATFGTNYNNLLKRKPSDLMRGDGLIPLF